MTREEKLVQALQNILEISYAGHPDGRETRLEVIARTATQALAKEDGEGKLTVGIGSKPIEQAWYAGFETAVYYGDAHHYGFNSRDNRRRLFEKYLALFEGRVT